jgi:hypothetical protein
MPRQPVNRGPELDPKTPTLEEIENELLKLDVNYWLRKTYDLDFGLAHSELTCVMEEVNDAVQKAFVLAADAKTDYEELEGATLMQLRQEWSSKQTDKMTVETLKAVMNQDKDLQKAWHRYTVLESCVKRYSNLMEHLRLKLGAMRSSEATRRRTIDDDRTT